MRTNSGSQHGDCLKQPADAAVNLKTSKIRLANNASLLSKEEREQEDLRVMLGEMVMFQKLDSLIHPAL